MRNGSSSNWRSAPVSSTRCRTRISTRCSCKVDCEKARVHKTARRKSSASLSAVLPALLTFAACLALWQFVSSFYLPVFFPGPAVLVERMIAIYDDPASYGIIGETLARIFEGFALSMLIGTALGLLMGLRRNIEIFFD